MGTIHHSSFSLIILLCLSLLACVLLGLNFRNFLDDDSEMCAKWTPRTPNELMVPSTESSGHMYPYHFIRSVNCFAIERFA